MTTRYPAVVSARCARSVLMVAAGLALGVLGTGCDQDDSASAAIESATIKLAGLAPGAVPAPGDTGLSAEYASVISTLQPVTGGSAGAGQKAAANALISRATYGQALAPLAAASSMQVDIVAGAAAARAALSSYLSESALARSVEAIDAGEDLRSLDAQGAAVEAALAQVTRQKNELDARISRLRSQARDKSVAAGIERAKDGELRERMSSSNQVQGLALMEEAAKHRRAADALDAEAADLEAQAAQLAPEAALGALSLESLAGQKRSLATAREHVEGRAAIAREQSAAAAAAAAAARDELTRAVDAVHGSIHGTGLFSDRVREAIDGFSKAASAAQKARQGGSAGASSAFAAARQAEGDAHWMNAQSLEVYASLLEAVAGADPALPDAARLAERAAEARGQQTAALDLVTAAYQEAREAYGGGDEGAAALDGRLIRLIQASSGGRVDLSAQMQDIPAEEPAPMPSEGAPADGPQATIQALIEASKAGDFSTMKDLIYISDESQRPVFDALFGVAARLQRLDRACEAKFGAKVSDQLGQMGGGQLSAPGMGSIDPAALETLSAADFRVTINGDSATAAAPVAGADVLNLRRVGGRWLLDPGSSEEIAGLAAAMPMIQAMGNAMDGLVRRVEAGEFQSIQQVTQALMMSMMGGGG